MSYKLLAIAAGALALGTTSAQAAVFVIDDFSTPQAMISDLVLDGLPVVAATAQYSFGGHAFSRDLVLNLDAADGNVGDLAQVALSVFDVNNSVGELTTASLSYEIPATFDAQVAAMADVTSMAVFFRIVDIDLNRVVFSASLNGVDLGELIPAPTTTGVYRFNVPLVPLSGNLVLSVQGEAGAGGYDVTIDSLRLFVGQRGQVFQTPAPGALALLALGMTAVLFSRRRR